jgi:CDP-glucose 4,6-dehydratase
VPTYLGKTLQNLPGPVLITGHTGFKGAWMTLLLQHLGISVVGYSLKPEKDSLYSRAKLKGQIPEKFGDIRSYKKLKNFINVHQPSVIIHLAAQPLVLESYRIPLETFDVNVMGTANLLDICFNVKSVQAVLVVTTDKVYRNDNSNRAFIESDPLEGHDPYSASKVGTESVVKAWQTISEVSGGPKVISVRAGNVIGGGDYAKNRLIPDLVRSILIKKEDVVLRNSESTRPWQHVLDPLVGYLAALDLSLKGTSEFSYNFGPSEKNLPVATVAERFIKLSKSNSEIIIDKPNSIQEAINLNLNTDKSREVLNWNSQWDQICSIELSFNWWAKVLNHGVSPKEACLEDIRKFLQEFESKVEII